MTYWEDYYNKNRERIRKKQREKYANMNPKDKEFKLAEQRERRKNETIEQRRDRLEKSRQRYEFNREKRLQYQRQYYKKTMEYIKELEKRVAEQKS